MYWCLNFADDCDKNKEWSDIFFDESLAKVWQGGGKECVTAGLGLTQNKSNVKGWFKSEITCGSEPKPIQTSMTHHSLAVADGLLAGNKLYAHTFGRRTTAIWGCCRRTGVPIKNGSISC
jgi:hypothetical protein